jgi:hypothetical protein
MASQTNHRVRVSPHVLATALIALGAASLSTWPGPAAQAQVLQVPNGSYQASCNNIHMTAITISGGLEEVAVAANCRKNDGTSVPAVLAIGFCVGDISNNNGALQCQTNGSFTNGRLP